MVHFSKSNERFSTWAFNSGLVLQLPIYWNTCYIRTGRLRKDAYLLNMNKLVNNPTRCYGKSNIQFKRKLNIIWKDDALDSF
jgi:hypothetical protein